MKKKSQHQTEYREVGGDYYDKVSVDKTLKFLRKRAATLGFKLEAMEGKSH